MNFCLNLYSITKTLPIDSIVVDELGRMFTVVQGKPGVKYAIELSGTYKRCAPPGMLLVNPDSNVCCIGVI